MQAISAEPNRRIGTWVLILDLLALAVVIILFLRNASVQSAFLVFLLVSANFMSGLDTHFRPQLHQRLVAEAARIIGLVCRIGALLLFILVWLGMNV
jgi:hypothetical protein